MRYLFAILVFLCSLPVYGQTIQVDRVRLNAGPCIVSSTAGPPIKFVLTGSCSNISTSASTDLTLSPTDDLFLTPVAGLTMNPGGDVTVNPTGNDVLPGTGYDINLGALTNKFLTLHAAELWVETLVAQNTLATIGGRILVAPTNTLVSDFGPSATTMTWKYNNFANGDRIYMESDGKVEFMAVISGPSAAGSFWNYNVTRDLDGSGANTWYAGDAAVNTGQTGNGFIDAYSVRGIKAGTEIGPTIVGNVRNSSTYNDWSPRWAIGNLDGLYGYSGSTYGTAFGNSAATNITIDATNGFRIRSGTTNKLTADTSGNLSIVGDMTVGTSGVIRSGKTACNTGVGWWLSYNGGSPELCVGDPANQYMVFNGTSLTVGGPAVINAGSINATGFADNVIKNGAFEGPDATAGLSGWSQDPNNVSGGSIARDCCGLLGPGTLLINNVNGGYLAATSRAFPVIAGQTYRVTLDVWADAASTAAMHIVVLESSADTQGVRNVYYSGASSPDINRTDDTFLCTDCAVSAGWQTKTYTYTVPAGIKWASLSFYNLSGTFLSSTKVLLHFDNVEMQKQIGPGHIVANSITADRLNVTTLSAVSANAGTITAGTITGVSITSTTGAIGGWTLGSCSLTGGDITLDCAGEFSAGTGNNIVRISDNGTNRLWVGHATATSAPFRVTQGGAVTASDITITGGSVTISGVTIDSNGLSLTAGGGSVNQLKWSDGTFLVSTSDTLTADVDSGGSFAWLIDGDGINLIAGGTPSFKPAYTGGLNLGATGSTSSRWNTLFLNTGINNTAWAGGGNQFVCVDNSGVTFVQSTACN